MNSTNSHPSSPMKVFKFGGASINSTERISNVAAIIKAHTSSPLFIIISAMGKTTNALEKVSEAFYAGQQETALSLFQSIKDEHNQLASSICKEPVTTLADLYTEVEWLLHDRPVRAYDYYYDQIVCCGELLSTAIISQFLRENGLNNQWIDVRDVIRTDDNFRDAGIDWAYTRERVNENILPLFSQTSIVVTQGFIGATDENESTTLGREGSDYSAAVFANLLDAESQTIWKDVEGVMNADPKKFPDAQFLPTLCYREVIEMAYYGAQVIHPKTIKPLQNKNIPLHVRCFLKPELPGTIIGRQPALQLPPIIVVKDNQVLMQMRSKDYSFVEDQLNQELHRLFDEVRIHPNLTQNGAIQLYCSLDDKPEKIEKLALAASELFDVQVEKGITLLTIRHYTPEIIQELTRDKSIILQQQTRETLQVLMK